MNTTIGKRTPAQKRERTIRLKQKHATWAQFPTARLVVDDPWRKVYEGGREVLNLDTELGRQAYEIRTLLMAARQNNLCGLCGFPMTQPSFDHENGRGMNGGHRDDRIEVNGVWQNAAVCLNCNSEKGSKRVPYLPHATQKGF
jgi:hypothetical protein